MTVSLGRQLFESPAEEKIVIHRAAWPASAIEYQRIVSSVLSPVLAGIQVIDDLPGSQEGPTKISVRGLTGDEAKLLDARLPPPEGSRNKPASKGTHRWAMELPRSVRSDPRFAMGTAARFPSWLELADGPTMLVVTVISPIMNELATVFRIREGAGPKTLKGAKKAVERSIAAHRMLGLDWRPIKDLLDPTLDAEAVIAARRRLIEGWAEPATDPGEGAMAFLCSRLAHSYYGKARKEGTAIRSQVINSKTEPVLLGTLQTWDSLLDYLGEHISDVDSATAAPISTRIPAGPPPEVGERIQLARRWFVEVFDSAHTSQEPGNPELWGLVPPSHASNWDEDIGDLRGEAGESGGLAQIEVESSEPIEPLPLSTDVVRSGSSEEIAIPDTEDASTAARGFDSNLWLTQLSPGMADSIWELWGTTVIARHPDVLVDCSYPEVTFAGILQPAAMVWEDIALTCWFLCFGPYSRTTLDGLEARLDKSLEDLSDLGCPVDRQVFRDLIAAGEGKDWLFAEGLVVSITIGSNVTANDDKPDADEVFVRLRDIVSRHRKAWLEASLDKYLEESWKRDLEQASLAYRELEAGRGKPPTAKQSYPKLAGAAKTWFGGDLSRLAGVLELAGPVAEMPVSLSDRGLPGDMRTVRTRVNELLGGTLDGEGNQRWQMRRRFDLSRHVDTVLTFWQASGELPSRPAFGKNWLLKEAFPDDFEQGYLEYIEAIRLALDETGHPAGEAPLAK